MDLISDINNALQEDKTLPSQKPYPTKYNNRTT
jgi:hypothetical protein